MGVVPRLGIPKPVVGPVQAVGPRKGMQIVQRRSGGIRGILSFSAALRPRVLRDGVRGWTRISALSTADFVMSG